MQLHLPPTIGAGMPGPCLYGLDSSWLCCVDVQALTQEDAAIKIQAGMRGHLSRKRTKQGNDEELSFIGMRPKVGQSSCCTSMACGVWCLSSMLVCAFVGSLGRTWQVWLLKMQTCKSIGSCQTETQHWRMLAVEDLPLSPNASWHDQQTAAGPTCRIPPGSYLALIGCGVRLLLHRAALGEKNNPICTYPLMQLGSLPPSLPFSPGAGQGQQTSRHLAAAGPLVAVGLPPGVPARALHGLCTPPLCS